jgi:hypothetical protein
MIPALIAAVASMVCAIIAAIFIDDRNRWLCIFAMVLGTAATLLSVCLNPEIFRPTLAWLVDILVILAIGIVTKVTGIARVTRAVVHLWPRRHHQNAGSSTGAFAAVDIATRRRPPADRD